MNIAKVVIIHNNSQIGCDTVRSAAVSFPDEMSIRD